MISMSTLNASGLVCRMMYTYMNRVKFATPFTLNVLVH